MNVLPARFWAKVNKDGPVPDYAPALGRCWVWTGLCVRGYGRYGRTGTQYAHRLVYLALVGPVPKDLELDHLCRVRSCVNPAHLETVTQAENKRRAFAAQTHCRRAGHELTGDNLRWKFQDGAWARACRTCLREGQAALRASRILCECGRMVSAARLAEHRRTAVHLSAVAS